MAILETNALAQSINFVTKFESDLHNLLALLGKTDVEKVAPGTAFTVYETTGSLSAATVAEKAEIPDSGYATGNGVVKTVTYKKYRNLTSIEKIGSLGYDLAVGKTNDAMRRDIQKGIRAAIIGAVTGAGSTAITTSTNTFQAKVAAAVGKVVELFEDEAATPIAFVNPADAFAYLGTANITVQSMFGISYIENFLGITTVILDSNVTAGAVFATAAENLNLIAAAVDAIPGMDMTTDETGIIAVHTGAKYENGAIQTVCYSGINVFPSILTRIVKCTYSA